MSSEIKHPREDEIAGLIEKQKQLINLQLRSCLSCGHFKEKPGEICGLYNQRPPARIIAFGCSEYEFIPF